MKKLVVCATLLAAAATVASAGEILGKVTIGGASVGDAATVSATCGEKKYPAVKTDKSGSYRIVIPESGKCTLHVGHKGQTADITVASYDDAAQADIVLESKDGKLAARRK